MVLIHNVEDLLSEEEHKGLYGRKRDFSLFMLIDRTMNALPEKALELIRYQYVEISNNDQKDNPSAPALSLAAPSKISYDIKYSVFEMGSSIKSETAIKGLLYASKYLENRYGEDYASAFLYNLRDMALSFDGNQCRVLKNDLIQKLEKIDRHLDFCTERLQLPYKSGLDRSIYELAVEVEKWCLSTSNNPGLPF